MNGFFPKIESFETVKDMAKQGMYSGLILTAMLGLGLAVLCFTDGTPVLGEAVYGQEKIFSMAGVGTEIAIVLLLTWRVSKGKAMVSGVLLTLIAVIEFISRVLAGPSIVSFVLFFWVFRGLINAMRASFVYDRLKLADQAEDVF